MLPPQRCWGVYVEDIKIWLCKALDLEASGDFLFAFFWIADALVRANNENYGNNATGVTVVRVRVPPVTPKQEELGALFPRFASQRKAIQERHKIHEMSTADSAGGGGGSSQNTILLNDNSNSSNV